MKFKILLFLSFLYVGCTTKNKSANSSSRATNTDSTKIWIQTARNNLSLSKSKRIQLLDKANNSINNYPDNTVKAIALSNLSLSYSQLGDTTSFRKKNKQLITLSNKLGDFKSHGEAHWDLGYYFRHNQPDSAIYHYKEAYNLFLKADLDSAFISYPGRVLYDMAHVKDNNKDYVGAEKDIVKAIKFYTENNITDRLFAAYNLLAVTLNGMGKYDKSLEYHKRAREFIPYLRESDRYKFNAININNIASTNLRKGDYAIAITFYEKLLNVDNLILESPESYAKAISGLAYAKFKNGETDFKKLSSLYLKSNRILDSLNNKIFKARNHEYYAELLRSENKIDLAIENALLAKNIAQENSNNDRILSSLKLLTTLDKNNSAAYAKTYFDLTEELQQKERAIQDKFARIELETDEAIEKNIALGKERKKLIWIGIAIVLLGLGAFIIVMLKNSNQKLKLEQKQQESNQEIFNLMLSQQTKFQEGRQLEQKRISEEIHDGILGQMLGIRLILSGLNERNDEAAIKQRAEIIEKSRAVEEEMRTISHELNDAAYQKINSYIGAVKDLVDTVGLSSNINMKFHFTDTYNWDTLNGAIKTNTYRILQESLQNAVKHAKCKNITVALNKTDSAIQLKVVDDGAGFNVKKGKKGIGHKNIISRVEKIDGNLKISSNFGKGTTISVDVPLQTTSEKTELNKTLI